MTIRYKCAECGAAMNINDELAGTEGNCPRCQVQFTVPAAEAGAGAQPIVPQPAVEIRQGSSSHSEEGPLSDDEIGLFLSSDPSPSSSSAGRRDAEADSDDELQTEKNPFDEHAGESVVESDDSESEKRSRQQKQKAKRGNAAAANPNAAKSASIAQSLMGRGAQLEVPDEPEKRKRRPFGGREERHDGQISSFKEVVTYFAKMGWPFVAGGGAFLALCFYLSFSMMKHFESPPLAPVTGTVTLDGKPLKQAIVKFVPVFEGPEGYKKGSTSFGFTGPDGKYTLIYASEGDKQVMGAIIGPHQVQIQLNDPTGAQLIPLRYSTYQSELKVDVAKGKGPIDFELKSETPEKTE